MNGKELACWLGNGTTYVLSALQTNQVFQIIEICFSILTSLVIIAFKIWQWWKKASEDGKIDQEEVNDLVNILDDGKKDIEDKKKGDKDSE